MTQADLFAKGEADEWYKRNKSVSRLPDPVMEAIATCQLHPQTILEIGCGNGWRLAEIKRQYAPHHVAGFDLSERAFKERVVPTVFLAEALGATKALSYIRAGYYDMVIFGFCLYLVDREDLLMLAGYTDRILKDGGHIVIHDFGNNAAPFKRAYAHKDGVFSYHMNHADLWLAHPAYRRIMRKVDNKDTEVCVDVLHKDMQNAFPTREPL